MRIYDATLMNTNKTRKSFLFDADLNLRLKRFSKEHGIDQTKLVQRALERYLRNNVSKNHKSKKR